MKTKNLNNKKILMLGSALVSLSVATDVQHAAAATTNVAATSALATIVTAIDLQATTNLHFGRLIAGATAGTATVDPAAAFTSTNVTDADGGSGTRQAAGFTIDGTQGIDIQVT